MDHGKRMTFNLLSYEDSEVVWSYSLHEITFFGFKLRSYNPVQICRYRMSCRWDGESNSYMPKLQSRMRTWLSLGNHEIHGYYRLVIGGGMTYNMGLTVPQSKITLPASNHYSGSAGRKHLGAHLPVQNRSGIIVDERTIEEITSTVNNTWRRVNQCTWRGNDKQTEKTTMWLPWQVTTNTLRESAEWIPGAQPARDWRWSVHQAQDGCQEHQQLHRVVEWSVRLQEHWGNDQKMIYAERGQWFLWKQFRTRPKMYSDYTK